MKRSLKLLLCIMAIAALLVSCELPMAPNDTHGHEFADANNDNICDVCGNNDGAATHGHDFVDANEDEVCDTCAAAAHKHTYQSAWSYDDDYHWHAATCAHSSEVADKAAHTTDALGVCTVCDVKVAGPDVSTIDKAIALAVSQKASVKAGTVGALYFEYRADYLYVKNVESGVEYFYSANGDGVLGVIKTTDQAYPDTMATVDNLEGPAINLAGAWDFYGAEDLVKTLWEKANEENALAGDVVVSIEDGVYSFTFGLDNYGPVVTTVEFTLDEDAYFIDSVKVTANEYYYGNYTEDDNGSYVINADAEIGWTYTVELEQADTVDSSNPFTPDMFTVSDFKFFDEYYDEISAVTVQLGYSTVIYLDALTPETLTFEFIDVVCAESDYISGFFNSTYNTLTIETIDAEIGETYTLTVTVGTLTKTIDVTVVAPRIDEVIAGVADIGEDDWGDVGVNGFDAITYETIEMYVGNKVILGVITYKGENGATVVAVGEDGSRTTLVAISTDNYNPNYYDMDAEVYYTVYAYDLSVLAPGNYTIGCISVDDPDVMTTVDVEVKVPQTLAEAFANNYAYEYIVEENYMLGNTYGRVTIIFSDVDTAYANHGYVQGTITLSYVEFTYDWWGNEFVDEESFTEITCYFTYENGAFSFANRFGNTVDIGYALKFDENNTLLIGFVNVEYGELESVAPEAPAGNAPLVIDDDTEIAAANATYEYTAASQGTLTISVGAAIMGPVSVSYTVNGGDATFIDLSSSDSIELYAGDVLVLTVEASGYSSFTTTWVEAE